MWYLIEFILISIFCCILLYYQNHYDNNNNNYYYYYYYYYYYIGAYTLRGDCCFFTALYKCTYLLTK